MKELSIEQKQWLDGFFSKDRASNFYWTWNQARSEVNLLDKIGRLMPNRTIELPELKFLGFPGVDDLDIPEFLEKVSSKHYLNCVHMEMKDESIEKIILVKTDEGRKVEIWSNGIYTGRHLIR